MVGCAQADPEPPRTQVKRALLILPEALEDLAQAADWYDARRDGLGRELLAVIDAAMQDVFLSPESWPRWLPSRLEHKCVARRFPYVVFFRFDDNAVTIVAVAHAKCRPGYWATPGRP
jgi:toxin ParE1/3/4